MVSHVKLMGMSHEVSEAEDLLRKELAPTDLKAAYTSSLRSHTRVAEGRIH